METDVSKFHPIGRDADSYRAGALIEAVTGKEIGLNDLIGRDNLLLESLAQLRARVTELEQAINEACELLNQPQGADWDERVEAWCAYYAEGEK